jgi:hypothetical protein
MGYQLGSASSSETLGREIGCWKDGRVHLLYKAKPPFRGLWRADPIQEVRWGVVEGSKASPTMQWVLVEAESKIGGFMLLGPAGLLGLLLLRLPGPTSYLATVLQL